MFWLAEEPEFEEKSTFQYERVPVFRFTQPEEHPFEAVLRGYESKVIVPLLRKIEQSLPDRSGKVFDLRKPGRFAHFLCVSPKAVQSGEQGSRPL
jgi:hypothetical protein